LALSQQEKNNSVDVQSNGVNITGVYLHSGTVPSRRYTSGEFESLAEAWRWRWRMFQPLLRRLRLQHKTSDKNISADVLAAGGQTFSRIRTTRQMYSGAE
jgi:hypothetical protein